MRAAAFSDEFHDKLGERIAQELVDLFNDMDANLRSDLRELNGINFDRFDDRLHQRLAESDARWQTALAERDTRWERERAARDARFETRLAEMDAKWETRLAEMDAKWETRLAAMDAKWEIRFSRMEARMADLRAELIKWMFIFWAGSTFTTLGAAIAILRLR